MDTLNGLPYLDSVVRETMRLYSPVAGTFRVAMNDDSIPTDVQWTDTTGAMRNSVEWVVLTQMIDCIG